MSEQRSKVGLPNFRSTSPWAELSSVPAIDSSWAHHGLAATSSGQLVGFHAGQLVTLDPDGTVARVAPTTLQEGHGITLVEEDGEELVWIADPGFVFACATGEGDEGLVPMFGKGLHFEGAEARVAQVTLDGQIRRQLPNPPLDDRYPPGPMGATFAPCGTAIDETRFGGNGDVWVADGYGSSLVHRYSADGALMLTLSGEEGSARFDCPHAVFIDRRLDREPELLIADRGNAQVQVYDLEGRYLRTYGEGFLNSPSGFARWGELLVIPELYARVAVVGPGDEFIGYIGDDDTAQARPGWPNALTADGRAQAPNPAPGRFNSPHSIAVDGKGNLYVAEWLIGGRYTKLAVID
jgi:hypothetical protein